MRTDPASIAFQSFMGNIETLHRTAGSGLRAFVGARGAGVAGSRRRNRQSRLVLLPARELIEMREPETHGNVMRSSGPLMAVSGSADDLKIEPAWQAQNCL
jgi:hypothetical protein